MRPSQSSCSSSWPINQHLLGTSCVNIVKVERCIRPKERTAANDSLNRPRFLETRREAAVRAGRDQAQFEKRGRTVHAADGLVAGTARAHGAILLTDDVRDFPMRDVRVESPPPNRRLTSAPARRLKQARGLYAGWSRGYDLLRVPQLGKYVVDFCHAYYR
jgi:predicted nucleic acid-binding protein